MKCSNYIIIIVLIIILSLPITCAYTYPANPQGIWHFDEGTGSIVYDSSGNNYSGTIIGGANWTQGHTGTALIFNGSDDYITMGTAIPNPTSQISISMWVNITESSGDRELIARYFRWPFGLYIGTNNQAVWGYTLDTNNYEYKTLDVIPYGWTHIVIIHNSNNGNITYYLNNTPHYATASYIGSFNSTIKALNIARSGSSSPAKYYNGTMDEVYVYNRTLSPDEVFYLYTGKIPVRSCGELNITGGYYLLQNNVTSSGNCFTIEANNITLDGQDHWVSVPAGYGVYSNNYNNITIKNIKITTVTYDGACMELDRGSYFVVANNTCYGGLSFYLANNGIISNNFVESEYSNSLSIVSGNNFYTDINHLNVTNGMGLFLSNTSNDNTVNNTIHSNNYAIGVDANCYNNHIHGGSISADQNDYYFYMTSPTTVFVQTNFTTRQLLFDTADSYFNYSDNDDVFLLTNVSSAVTITRKLVTWSKNLTNWNDSGTVTAYYEIFGLYPNTKYNISNNSVNSYNLTTNSSGILPVFSIAMNGNTEIVVQKFIPKTYWNLSGNVKNSLGIALENARIDIGDNYTFTDVNGNYSFSNIIEGNYIVLVRAINYENLSKTVDINKDTSADFILVERNYNTAIKDAGIFGFFGGIVGAVMIIAIMRKKRK